MSLYSLDEVCNGCDHAVWMEGRERRAFDFCVINADDLVDHVRGKCPEWFSMADPKPPEESADD